MADIDAVLNPYLDEVNYSWQPSREILENKTEGGGLPVRRAKNSAVVWRGMFTARFPSALAYETFLTFWNNHLGPTLSWTWTNPVDGLVYTCLFDQPTPGYIREGPEEFVCRFALAGVR